MLSLLVLGETAAPSQDVSPWFTVLGLVGVLLCAILVWILFRLPNVIVVRKDDDKDDGK